MRGGDYALFGPRANDGKRAIRKQSQTSQNVSNYARGIGNLSPPSSQFKSPTLVSFFILHYNRPFLTSLQSPVADLLTNLMWIPLGSVDSADGALISES